MLYVAQPAMRLALLLTLAMRALYLLRFGGDPQCRNAVHLGQARSLIGGPPRCYGPPASVFALAGARLAGLGPVGAVQLLYLAAHLVFTAGVMALASWLWPSASRTRRV